MNNLKQNFRQWQEVHPNPFTAEIVNLERADNKVIELSKDPHKEFYGVAVWQKENEDCNTCKDKRPQHWRFKSFSHDISKSFHDRDEAVRYQNLLKQKIKNHQEIEDILQDLDQ